MKGKIELNGKLKHDCLTVVLDVALESSVDAASHSANERPHPKHSHRSNQSTAVLRTQALPT